MPRTGNTASLDVEESLRTSPYWLTRSKSSSSLDARKSDGKQKGSPGRAGQFGEVGARLDRWYAAKLEFYTWLAGLESFDGRIDLKTQLSPYLQWRGLGIQPRELWIALDDIFCGNKGAQKYVLSSCMPEFNWEEWRSVLYLFLLPLFK
jgi:hypothetical protein